MLMNCNGALDPLTAHDPTYLAGISHGYIAPRIYIAVKYLPGLTSFTEVGFFAGTAVAAPPAGEHDRAFSTRKIKK